MLQIAWFGAIVICDSNRESQITSDLKGSALRFSVSRRGGRNKWGRKQMRANANKRRQTQTNASKRRGENASKRKRTRANVDKRKQTLTPPFIAVFYTPLCNPLRFCCDLKRASNRAIWAAIFERFWQRFGIFLRFGLRDLKSLAIRDLWFGPHLHFGS